ncbi:MAG: DUF2502 domain-containing protein [Gibbsiella quercinecans]|uniref:DUF2502 domain-containing protein n=1 Tax=Gibbsiella quercinecans TaxID=929813 RepID=UPI00337453E6
MKKILLLVCLPLMLPLAASADVSIDINVPGVSVHLGDRDSRGYYWDGYDWRPPQWWHAHQGHGIGERNGHGMYWDGGRWQPQPPHGQNNAPRGGNPFRGEHGHDNGGDRRDNHGNDKGHGNDRGHDNGPGQQQYPQRNNGPHN